MDSEHTRRTSILDGLAATTIKIMRLLRAGPYGHNQRTWQAAMEEGRTLMATQVPLQLAFERFDEANRLPLGTTTKRWILEVLSPGCSIAAQLLNDLHVVTDHPLPVQRGLFECGLLPAMAAGRIVNSRDSLCEAISRILRAETLQSLRCPDRQYEYSWCGQLQSYSKWVTDQRRCDPQQQVVYPVTETNWSLEVRTRQLPLRVTLNAEEIDVDIQQRLWQLNQVKILGTLLWHPKISNVSNILLRNIGHTDPNEQGVTALSKYLREQNFDSIASPILMVDAIEKTSDVSHDELKQAVNVFVSTLLKVHSAGQHMGTVVWNTLPAPWIYPPGQSDLLSADWKTYMDQCQKIEGTISKVAADMRINHGHAMGSLMLKWARKT